MSKNLLSKDQIRREILRIRNSLSENEMVVNSNIISNMVISTKEYKKSSSIGLYFPIGSEVNTIEIMKHSLATNRTISLPRIIDSNQILFFKIIENSFEDIKMTKGKYGILENSMSDFIITKMDLLIVPGIAFDLKGNRIGYGKGYYDRFLSKLKANNIMALAFENQIIDKVPKTQNDIPVNVIVTEKRIIYI